MTTAAINRALGPDQMAAGYRRPGAAPRPSGGGGGMTGQQRMQLASGITNSVAQMTTGITQAILGARQARRAPAAEPAGPEPIGGEPYGIQARTPWGTIALGATGVIAVLGTILYFSGKQKVQQVQQQRAAAAQAA